MTSETENRIIDLETRLAFLEATLDELNTVITKQQNQFDDLLVRFKELAAQAKESLLEKEQPQKPPHY